MTPRFDGVDGGAPNWRGLAWALAAIALVAACIALKEFLDNRR